MKVRINDENNFYNGRDAMVTDISNIAGVDVFWVKLLGEFTAVEFAVSEDRVTKIND